MLDPVNSYMNNIGSKATITSPSTDKPCTIVERAVYTLNQTPNEVLFSHRTNNRAILPGFNFSMDKLGNIAVLSTPKIKTPQVWILKKDSGLWRINCELINPDAKEFASSESLFGQSTALSDDGCQLFVGSPGYNEKEGRVYCFQYIGLSDKPYDLIQRLTPEYQGRFVSFGKSVAVSGDGEFLYVGVTYAEGGGTIITYNLRHKTYDLVENLGKDSVYGKVNIEIRLEKEKIDKLKDFASKLGMSLDELINRVLSNSEILN